MPPRLCLLQAASLEELEQHAAASEAEAEALREEQAASEAALAERAASEAAIQRQLRSTEARLAQLEGKHRELQAAHSALQAAHTEQGQSLRGRLLQAKSQLGEVAAEREAATAAAAQARQEVAELQADVCALRSEAGAARQQLQQAEHEAATWRGRYQAVQHANDGLRLQLTANSAGSTRAKPAPLGPVAASGQLPPSPARPLVPVTSPGCRITAAAAAAEQWDQCHKGGHCSPGAKPAARSPNVTCTCHPVAQACASPRITAKPSASISVTAVAFCHHSDDGDMQP